MPKQKGAGKKKEQLNGKHTQVFTVKMLDALKPEAKKYYKRESGGFTIRVMPSGVKTWLYVYTFEGKRKEMNLGQYPDVLLSTARERHGDAKKLLANGIDPGATDRQEKEERRKAPTMADLCDEYLKKWAESRKKSWKEDERTIKADILPVLGKLKVKDITRRDVVLLLEEKAKTAPVMANRVQALLSKIFNFGIDRHVCDANPCVRLKLTKEKPKERALSDAEIVTVWAALCDGKGLVMSDEVRKALKLILLTGQRPGEVAGMHSSEVDGEWWTMPGAKTKNGKPHRVYLTQTTRSLIEGAEGYVFPAPIRKKKESEGEATKKPISEGALPTALRRNLTGQSFRNDKVKRRKGEGYKRGPYKSKALPEDPNRIGIDPFTPHDLRRTMATGLAKLRISDEVIDAVLNHAKPGIVRVYNVHNYDEEKKAALLKWEEKLLGLIAGKGRVAA